MTALGLHCEEGVECNDSIDFGHGNVQIAGYLALHLFRQVAEVTLAFMKDVDQFTGSITELRALFNSILSINCSPSC